MRTFALALCALVTAMSCAAVGRADSADDQYLSKLAMVGVVPRASYPHHYRETLIDTGHGVCKEVASGTAPATAGAEIFSIARALHGSGDDFANAGNVEVLVAAALT